MNVSRYCYPHAEGLAPMGRQILRISSEPLQSKRRCIPDSIGVPRTLFGLLPRTDRSSPENVRGCRKPAKFARWSKEQSSCRQRESKALQTDHLAGRERNSGSSASANRVIIKPRLGRKTAGLSGFIRDAVDRKWRRGAYMLLESSWDCELDSSWSENLGEEATAITPKSLVTLGR